MFSSLLIEPWIERIWRARVRAGAIHDRSAHDIAYRDGVRCACRVHSLDSHVCGLCGETSYSVGEPGTGGVLRNIGVGASQGQVCCLTCAPDMLPELKLTRVAG